MPAPSSCGSSDLLSRRGFPKNDALERARMRGGSGCAAHPAQRPCFARGGTLGCRTLTRACLMLARSWAQNAYACVLTAGTPLGAERLRTRAPCCIDGGVHSNCLLGPAGMPCFQATGRILLKRGPTPTATCAPRSCDSLLSRCPRHSKTGPCTASV